MTSPTYVYNVYRNYATPRQRFIMQQMVYGIPFAGSVARGYGQMRYYDDYLRSRGMTWDDVKYPANMNTAIPQAMSQAVNFVSSNVGRLYKSSVNERVSQAYDRGYRNANNYWRGFIRGSR